MDKLPPSKNMRNRAKEELYLAGTDQEKQEAEAPQDQRIMNEVERLQNSLKAKYNTLSPNELLNAKGSQYTLIAAADIKSTIEKMHELILSLLKKENRNYSVEDAKELNHDIEILNALFNDPIKYWARAMITLQGHKLPDYGFFSGHKDLNRYNTEPIVAPSREAFGRGIELYNRMKQKRSYDQAA